MYWDKNIQHFTGNGLFLCQDEVNTFSNVLSSYDIISAYRLCEIYV